MPLKYINILINKSGQTILEVVIALMMITLFLSGVTMVQLTAAKNITYSENKSIATRLARQQLERARAVRDMSGIDSLQSCQSQCYINTKLTPVQIIPTGTFVQTLRIITDAVVACPLPDVTTSPAPNTYQAISQVSWDLNVNVTPAPVVEMSSCITDWR